MGKQLASIRSILSESFAVAKENAAIFIQPLSLLLLADVGVYIGSTLLTTLPAILTLFIVYILIKSWIAAALLLLVNALLVKQKISLATIYQKTSSLYLKFLLVNILVAALFSVGVILAIVILFTLSNLATLLDPSLGIGVLIIGVIAILIVAIVYLLYFEFAEIVVLLESKNNTGIRALKQSYGLVVNRWSATFIRLFVPTFLVMFVGYFASVGIYAIINLGDITLSSITTAPELTYSIISELVFLALTPILTAISVILYRNLKATKS